MLKKILLLTIAIGLLLNGCSGKRKEANKNSENNDLFVEYNAGYFPDNYHSLKSLRNLQISHNRKSKNRSTYDGALLSWSNFNASADDKDSNRARRQLLRAARSAIGTPYVVGGTSPGGFDCSGLVCWAYGNVGVKLPRTAREQSVVGRRICDVSQMREGDIVAFRHPKRGYHTGIYVGDGKFIHSPRRRTRVKINSLDDPYFSATFLGARRVNLAGREDLLAQAEQRLTRDYSYASSVRRYKREEYRTSRNASREYRNSRYSRKGERIELAERRRGKHRGSYVAERRSRRSDRSEVVERRSRNGKRFEQLDENRSSKRKVREVAYLEKNSKKDQKISRNQKSNNSEKKSAREMHVAEKNKSKQANSDKKDLNAKRGTQKNQTAAKNEKKHHQVSVYENKRDKKQVKSEKKKRTSDKS